MDVKENMPEYTIFEEGKEVELIVHNGFDGLLAMKVEECLQTFKKKNKPLPILACGTSIASITISSVRRTGQISSGVHTVSVKGIVKESPYTLELRDGAVEVEVVTDES